MKTFRYVYGITLGATTETHRQDIAVGLQAVVRHRRSATGVDEVGVSLLKSGAILSIMDTDGQKGGSYRRGWVGPYLEEKPALAI